MRVDRGAVERFTGLGEVVSGRVVDARIVLAGLSAVYAMVCALALLPGWLHDGHAVIAVAALSAAVVAVVLLRIRVLPEPVAHSVLAAAPLLLVALVLAADGGVDSAAFAYLTVFVTAYAAMFFSRRALAAHLTWSLISAAALSATDLGNRENGYFAVVLAITMTSTGMLLSRLVRRVWSAATIDPLTGLLNEAGLRAAAAGAERGGLLIVCDIDHFARVNDALGRDDGDELLRAVARALARLWPGAAHARLAADVFATWLPTPRRGRARRRSGHGSAHPTARRVSGRRNHRRPHSHRRRGHYRRRERGDPAAARRRRAGRRQS